MSLSIPAMATPSRADNRTDDELRPLSATLRLLRRMLDPATAAKASVAACLAGPAILSGIHPFQPHSLLEALEEAYHQYHGCGPGAPIVWRQEEMPVLFIMARAMMQQDHQKNPSAPAIPILPTAPGLPLPAPTLPCCTGSPSVLPANRRKPGKHAMAAGASATSPA